jgi:hypothetical protein
MAERMLRRMTQRSIVWQSAPYHEFVIAEELPQWTQYRQTTGCHLEEALRDIRQELKWALPAGMA